MAGLYPLKIAKGETFVKNFQWKHNGAPVDLTGAKGRMQIKSSSGGDKLYMTFDSEIDDSFTFPNPTQGRFRLSKSAAQTLALYADSGEYDIFIELASGFTKKLLKGSVCFEDNTTEPAE